MLWCTGADTWCLVTLTAESHNPFSCSDCKKSNQCCLPLHPSLFLPCLHLPRPAALVKANMLETSPELSRRLEARLRIAKVRALVSLQQCEFNVCYPADWACYSAAWLKRWWRDVLTYQDTGDLNVRKQKFLLDQVGVFVWMQVWLLLPFHLHICMSEPLINKLRRIRCSHAWLIVRWQTLAYLQIINIKSKDIHPVYFE